MASTGQIIVEKENLPKNIERLAAQNEIYFQAKRLFMLQFIVTGVVTILLALIAVALSYLSSTLDLNWVRGSYGVIAATGDLFLLNHFINQLRQKAACVQELFDCDVLGLQWNAVCCGEQIRPEDIKKYADKHLKRVKSYDKLKTWYADTIKEVDGPAAKVICQRSNFAYDAAIRKSFLFWVVGISLTILVGVLVIALIMNAPARAIASMSLFPILPILVFLGKLAKEHRASLQNLDSLNSAITRLWSEVLAGTAQNADGTIRQIQDKIYQNRKTSPLIPEWFFDWKRPGLEQQMYYGVDELVRQYQAR
jgi:SMODS-associating 4TM effector domain